MCGICGINCSEQKPIDHELLTAMTTVLKHRGPDQEGFYHEPGVGMGFRRLAIIDLTTGAQPMKNEDESVIITFNGEVYNFLEIRPQLEAHGHVFRTQSDTEVILHTYEEYGLDFIRYLRGMYGLAIWDRNKRRLVLARDRLGQKPIFYHHAPGRLVYASELKSLLQDSSISRELSPEMVDRYIAFRYTESHEQTILKEVKRVPPGHILVYYSDSDSVEISHYWTPYKNQRTVPPNEEEINALLREAVRLRMISDVPLGALLSGGMDSSIVVALMAEFSELPVKTFSIGFDEEQFNELPHARLIAERYATDHYEYVVTPGIEQILPELVWFLDEPFGDSSALPTYYVTQMACQQVTVLLSGDGGDENFAGYRRYKSVLRTLRYQQLPLFLRKQLFEPMLHALPRHNAINRLQRMVNYADQSLPDQYTRRVLATPSSLRHNLYHPAFSEQFDNQLSEMYLSSKFLQSNELSPLAYMLLVELTSTLTNDYLVKVDRMSMAHSVELRSPFLDHKLIEATIHLPDKDRMLWYGPGKRILRRLYGDMLPKELLKKPKAGFSVPVHTWLRGPLLELLRDILLDSHSQQRGIFQTDVLAQLIDSHVRQQENLGHALWSIMMFELWLRKFVDSPHPTQ
jgi:asparagine synthase (glutamine-hydrolysing)